MKYLKYTLLGVAILALGFLLIGVISPKLDYDCEIMVEKSATESWNVLQDEEKLSEWLPGLLEIEHVSGTPGTEGAVSMVHFDNDGEKMSIKETITAIVPQESIAMKYEDDFMDMAYQISLTPMGGKTKIVSNTSAEGNGMFAKSLIALIGGSIKAQEEANLASLKQTIEQNTKDYVPAEEEISEMSETEEGL
ncbi:SRPBCC family protein [Marinoscillum sp.]|uniref:SRPBCC family protein n=1 Tax=Marinoscillum sp. TaxID=2024838 RepID=UPI003BAB807B